MLICEFAVIFNSGKRTICRDFKEPQVLQEPMAMPGPRDLKDFKELKEVEEPKEPRGPKVVQAQTEPKVIRELKEPKALREVEAPKALRAHRVLLDLQ